MHDNAIRSGEFGHKARFALTIYPYFAIINEKRCIAGGNFMSDQKDFQIEKGILKQYWGTGGDIIIPDGVTHIKIGTFEDDWNITSVRLPESMTEVSYWAFSGCKNLKSVYLPETIQKIGGYAFMHCVSLTHINIPESVKTIGDYAFISCENLTELRLPSDAEISSCAFKDCRGLADENGMVILKDVLFDYIGENLQIEIPENITEISGYVFHKYDRLENLIIKSNITIGRNAFAENLWLEKCTLAPDKTDAEDAKQIIDAVGTRILAIPFLKDTLETNPVLKNILLKRMILKPNRSKLITLLIEKYESELLAKLLSLVPKMPVDEIDSYIKKAEGLAEICASLLDYKEKLYSPDDLCKMEEIEMEKNFGLRRKTLADYRKIFTLVKDGNEYQLKKYKGENPYVIIPGQIKGIPVVIHSGAFSASNRCTQVDIEEGMTEISAMAFAWCDALREINIPEGVTSIGERAFVGCRNLVRVTIPKSLIKLDNMAFNNCGNLQELVFEGETLEISQGTFNGCERLQKLVLPKNITINASSVHGKFFYNCPRLTVYAPAGGTAEAFAKAKEIPFYPIETVVHPQ